MANITVQTVVCACELCGEMVTNKSTRNDLIKDIMLKVLKFKEEEGKPFELIDICQECEALLLDYESICNSIKESYKTAKDKMKELKKAPVVIPNLGSSINSTPLIDIEKKSRKPRTRTKDNNINTSDNNTNNLSIHSNTNIVDSLTNNESKASDVDTTVKNNSMDISDNIDSDKFNSISAPLNKNNDNEIKENLTVGKSVESKPTDVKKEIKETIEKNNKMDFDFNTTPTPSHTVTPTIPPDKEMICTGCEDLKTPRTQGMCVGCQYASNHTLNRKKNK